MCVVSPTNRSKNGKEIINDRQRGDLIAFVTTGCCRYERVLSLKPRRSLLACLEMKRVKLRCSVSRCQQRRENTPSECDIPAGGVTSYHALPSDEPRRSKWLRFLSLANGEKELKQASSIVAAPTNQRVCSLHFLPSDYHRDLSVSALLGCPPARRRLINSAIPSVVLPGQTEHSVQSECISATSSGIPSQEVPEQTDLQGSSCVGTEITSISVGNDKGVQALVRGRNKGVQINFVAKETCDRATQVRNRDVRPTSTPVKRRHPEAHLPSPGVSRVRGKDDASDTMYKPGGATLTSHNTLGDE